MMTAVYAAETGSCYWIS